MTIQEANSGDVIGQERRQIQNVADSKCEAKPARPARAGFRNFSTTKIHNTAIVAAWPVANVHLLLFKQRISKPLIMRKMTVWMVDRFNGRGKNKVEHAVAICATGKKADPFEQQRCLQMIEADKKKASRFITERIVELWRTVGSAMSLWAKGDLMNLGDLRLALTSLQDAERLHACYYLFYYYPGVTFPGNNGCTFPEYLEVEFMAREGIEYEPTSMKALGASMKSSFQLLFTTIYNDRRGILIRRVTKKDRMTLTIENKAKHEGNKRGRRSSKTRFYGKPKTLKANNNGGAHSSGVAPILGPEEVMFRKSFD
jgi:hypothetical protein